jgi:clan AA aspartic protease
MITGVVRSGEACIRLKVMGLRGLEEEVDAVIDTGYSSALTLPPAIVSRLNLRWQTVDRATLADGEVCIFDVYEAQIAWDGRVRRILVDEADTEPLVGMKLLRGHELRIQVRSRGKVTIKRLAGK